MMVSYLSKWSVSLILLWIFLFLGYIVPTQLGEYIDDRARLLTAQKRLLFEDAKKWRSKLSKQPRITSYHTTKWAQLQVIGISKELGPHIDTRCDAIKLVAADLRVRMRELYKRKKLGHEHYKTAAMRKLFKTARASVKRAEDDLTKLKEKKERVVAAVNQISGQIKKLENSPTPNVPKLTQAKSDLIVKEDALHTVKERIVRTQKRLDEEQDIYRERATEIFEKCQIYEQERLNLIRVTLIKFVRAMHSSEYSANIDGIFENVLEDIMNKQSTSDDLRFWAETYGVYDSSDSDEDTDEETHSESSGKSPTEQVEEEEEASADTVTTDRDRNGDVAIEPSMPDHLEEIPVWEVGVESGHVR